MVKYILAILLFANVAFAEQQVPEAERAMMILNSLYVPVIQSEQATALKQEIVKLQQAINKLKAEAEKNDGGVSGDEGKR